ncbi:hypothetical protein LCGC14_2165870 [marine sediment metagenome]|uniref:Uncharacterized protein n=1 Tax=marine sediment metagenome TaxID=412755 RepID=A0A0F9DRJ7_9ZZZZ
MNEGNFLRSLSGIVSGDRFLKEKELPLHGHIRASNDYLPLVTGDVPTWVEDGIQWDDGETAFLDFNIPQDYDEGVDACALRLHLMPSADAAHTTDMGLTTAQALYRAGAAVDNTTVSAVAESATASTDQLVREAVLNLSGNGYKPGDRIRRTLDANNSGTTELILLGIDLIYGSCVRGYNADDYGRNIGNG